MIHIHLMPRSSTNREHRAPVARTLFVRAATSFQARGDPILLRVIPPGPNRARAGGGERLSEAGERRAVSPWRRSWRRIEFKGFWRD
jgi:hypothetical protein